MTTIKFRRDTSANWISVNPIPAQGEPCYETDTGKLKIGNGSDNYVALPYVSDGGGSAGTTDYTQLENKPQINSIELTGNKTLDDLGIQAKGNYQPAGDYATTADIPTKTSELTNDSGFLTEVPIPANMVTTDTDQTIEGVKRFTSRIESNNITMGGTANVTLNGGALVINQSTTGDTYPSRIFKDSNCITVKNGIPKTITSSDFFAIVDRANNKVLSVNSGTGVTFTNNNGESYKLLTSHDLSNFIDTNYLEWNGTTEKITIKKDAVVHLATPSSTSVDLTLGASGTSYTAPADGWVVFKKEANSTGQFVYINGNGLETGVYSPYTGLCELVTNAPVSKNKPFSTYYSADGNTKVFNFIYAIGAVPSNTEPNS